MSEMDEMNRATQNFDVLDCMKKKGYITNRIASSELGVERLSARIYDLREMGFSIKTTMVNGKNRHGNNTRFARYSLEKVV